MPWVTISLVLGIVLMLVVGILVMYPNTLNTTMNFASSYGLMPVVVLVVLVVAIALLMSTTRGFG